MYKVFLVDDDHYVRKGMMKLVDWQYYGFSICGDAANGEDALEQIMIEPPDLVITDIRMPVIDGLDLIESLHEKLSTTPYFIVISGYNDFKYAQKALRYGVQDFILKPIDHEEIQQTLKKVVTKLETEKRTKKYKEKMLTVTLVKGLLQEQDNLLTSDSQHLMFCHANQFTAIIIEVNGINKDAYHIYTKTDGFLEQYTYSESTALFELSPGKYFLCITDLFLTRNDLELQTFIDNLYHFLDMDGIFIYVGITIKQLSEIKKSFQSVNQTIQYKYIDLHTNIFLYQKLQHLPIYNEDLEAAFYTKLRELIEEHHMDGIKEAVKEMMALFNKKRMTADAIHHVINRVIHDVLDLLRGSLGEEQRISNVKQIIEWERVPLTAIQLQSLVTDFLVESSKTLCSCYQNNVHATIHEIKKYISTHFDQELTLKSIANKFYMNPVYMGQLFKKTYGVYFKDFLLKLRIDEAKKLLRQTDMRVYEIAEKVGFNNSDYFVTQFEKMAGKTPSQYRKFIITRGMK